MTYRPEGSVESSLQLSDPAANKTTLTDLRNNTYYTITVVATAGDHRRESEARRVLAPLQGTSVCVAVYIHLTHNPEMVIFQAYPLQLE